jgi:hypothetical protein
MQYMNTCMKKTESLKESDYYYYYCYDTSSKYYPALPFQFFCPLYLRGSIMY